MHRSFVCVAVFCALGLVFAGTASAQLTIDIAGQPSTDLPGFTTYVLTANTNTDEVLIGFNFADPNGFSGPMNQVRPANMDTPFNNLNGFFGDTPVDNDSQFRVDPNDGVSVNVGEGPDSLQGAFNFTGGNNAGDSWDFVQLAIPDNGTATVMYEGLLTGENTAGRREVAVMGMVPMDPGGDMPIPFATGDDPTDLGTVLRIGSGLPGPTMSEIADAFTVGNDPAATADYNVTGVDITGPDAALFDIPDFAATLLAPGETVQFDAKFLGAGTSDDWQATATFLTDVPDVSFSFDLIATTVPEPASLALIGLAMIGLVGFRRR